MSRGTKIASELAARATIALHNRFEKLLVESIDPTNYIDLEYNAKTFS
jgi:hypothetical protein